MAHYSSLKEERKPTTYQKLANGFCATIEASFQFWEKERPNKYLSDAFAPVDEGGLVGQLLVKGELPDSLNGEYVRNGPNPRFKPTRGYHWFDGDGMLHGVRIKDGKASYVNRYVRTSRLSQEEMYGAPAFLKIGDLSGWAGLRAIFAFRLRKLLGVLDFSDGDGTGNTSLVYHSGQLMATNESDAPYVIKVLEDGQLETIGRNTYGGALNHPFTAHPKVDPVTGEMFTFGYEAADVEVPLFTFRVVSPEGSMSDPVRVVLPRPIMMHDFAITENYSIFMDLPLVFSPKDMVKKGFPIQFDSSIPSRFGILPRYAKSEAAMKWFTLPSFCIFHTANAWEEGDEIVLIACHIPKIELGEIENPEKEVDQVSTLYEFRFNMDTGKASMRQLADFFADFPRINESYVGRKQRYVYAADMKSTKVIGVAKYDLQRDSDLRPGRSLDERVGGVCVGYFSHGSERFGSEPVFVPRGDGAEGDEDDGYLLNFVHDEKLDVSEMVVIDAKTMSSTPVAVVTLPRRVPYGFHGIFVSEDQLKMQK